MENPKFSILRTIQTKLAALFGQLHWSSPPWIRRLNAFSKTSPLAFWSGLILGIVVLFSLGYGIYWIKTQPKPLLITAHVIIPAITANEENLIPNPLIINFGFQQRHFMPQSVAPLRDVGKVVTQGVTLNPSIPGQWTWASDSQLVFTPSEDWPAQQSYAVRFASNFFRAHVPLESHQVTFTTKPFRATLGHFRLVQDPVEAKMHYVVATLNFNFPVDPSSLEHNTQLVFQDFHNNHKQYIHFKYTLDKNKRVATLRSDPIAIQNNARTLMLNIKKSVAPASGSGTLSTDLNKTVVIPDKTSFLQISGMNAKIVRTLQGKPEQVLSIETTIGVNAKSLEKALHVYLLPKDRPATAIQPKIENYTWQNPGEVTQDILAQATPISPTAIPEVHPFAALHGFRFMAPTPRSLYVKIDKGLQGFGDFILNNGYQGIVQVPEFPREIRFLHQGSLLALGSEQKLSVLVRGLPAVKFEFARVLPDTVNQLITQTLGDFNNPYFINPSFNQQNISTISSEIQHFPLNAFNEQHYTALDLAKYNTPRPQTNNAQVNAQGPHGLFLLQATGWDPSANTALDVKSRRLILMTDLGLLVKDNSDGSHEVYVSSITANQPVVGATLSILGKNGLPLMQVISDAQGHGHFPNLNGFTEDKEPTVYLASLNQDVSFIPYSNYSRQLNFSKFDVGGIYTNSQGGPNPLSAYLFSDRGLYRPGDLVHLGLIVKQSFVHNAPPGLPLQMSIVDPRGMTVLDKKITLNDMGYMTFDFTPNVTSPTGQYTVQLVLVKDGHPDSFLGSTTFRVMEFQPDRMRIQSEIKPNPQQGWSSPDHVTAQVDLWNLYGAPAANRKISAKILLTPKPISFNNFPDYVFADPLLDPKKPPKVFSERLNDSTTNDQGQASFDLHLERFEQATYELTFFAEGFEADGGRSVTTQSKTFISPLPYFVGYKADGELGFIQHNSDRHVQFLAINTHLQPTAVADLKLKRFRLQPITTLVKKSDGTYVYQSVIQSTELSTIPFQIGQNGNAFSLPTQDIGDFELQVVDQNNRILSQLRYTVVGQSETPVAKNAELSIKLDKENYHAGDTITLQLTAPYAGAGLITLERDKIYASTWFNAQTPTSLQHIQIPADFRGDGYVNVAFIRNWDSPDIFMSPLSYGVLHFSVSHEDQDMQVNLQTDKIARSGEPLKIRYRTNKPGKIVVFAVDEGILQVGRFQTPDPLGFFFQKHALEVSTQQTVDQILPKYVRERELSAAGGDEGEILLTNRLNPFKRKRQLPVVFWSGILDSNDTFQEIEYTPPDLFNGTLKIMAVAVGQDAVGSAEDTVIVRNDLVLNPNAPVFVAPNDVFQVSVSIANPVKGQGSPLPLEVSLQTSPFLEVMGTHQQNIQVNENQEQTVFFKLRALPHLGSTQLTFIAKSEHKSATMHADLSIRPATPQINDIHSGQMQSVKKSFSRTANFYAAYHTLSASISDSPLLLVFGLQRYLEEFPFGCTEQLISKAMPLLALHQQPQFFNNQVAVDEKINTTIGMIAQRQMANGGFSYWPGQENPNQDGFASIYAMHFLTQAKSQGYAVANAVFNNGINFLKSVASQEVNNLDNARLQAYAIYVLTRNEIVTTDYLTRLQLQLGAFPQWKTDITSAFLASSYQLLKSTQEANRLIGLYQIHNKNMPSSDFFNHTVADAQYFYLVAQHFPNLLPQISAAILEELVQSVNTDTLNTLLCGHISLALGAYPTDKTSTGAPLSISATLSNGQEKTLLSNPNLAQPITPPLDAKAIHFHNPEKRTAFYQLIETGFLQTPSPAQSHGIEIVREYQDGQGHVTQTATLGQDLEVHIQIRATQDAYLANVAIEDVLPGGFEVISDTVKADFLDYFDLREDRINFFCSLDGTTKTIVYRIRPTSQGTFTIPPIFAQSMYNPALFAQGDEGKITVTM